MEDFKHYLKTSGEYGVVIGLKETLVIVEGLPGAKINEKVIFENGAIGQVITVSDEFLQIITFDKQIPLIGEKVSRSDDMLTVGVGIDLVGRMIDPLGRSIIPFGRVKDEVKVRLFKSNRTEIFNRAKINKQLVTGTLIADSLLPLGEGQRELIIGDRKTGETSFLLSTVVNQVRLGKTVIIGFIGKRKSEVKKIIEHFEKENVLKKIILVVSTSDDSPNLIYLIPFTAMSVAEYFKDKGKDTLVILDDLSTHARFYRQISLIANKYPGRESYPGDIFHIHANLLERAGNFKQENKTVSITCLPVAEVVEGDFTGYITTNLMGITDGHIYFDKAIFSEGKRPAVNHALSVTRVGRQTQPVILRELNHQVTAFLSEYEQLKNLTHFGAELSESIKLKINKGERISEVFEQKSDVLFPLSVEIILLTVAFYEEFFDISIEKTIEKLTSAEDKSLGFFDSLVNTDNLNELKERLVKNKNKLC